MWVAIEAAQVHCYLTLPVYALKHSTSNTSTHMNMFVPYRGWMIIKTTRKHTADIHIHFYTEYIVV